MIHLVRHGHTPLNESGVLRGLLDPPLDEAGHQQASRLAAVLGPRMPRAIVASPLLRATQTAQPVAGRAGLNVATDERLLDGDYDQYAALLPVDERVPGPDHPHTLTARANLAYYTGRQGMQPGPATSLRHCCCR